MHIFGFTPGFPEVPDIADLPDLPDFSEESHPNHSESQLSRQPQEGGEASVQAQVKASLHPVGGRGEALSIGEQETMT